MYLVFVRFPAVDVVVLLCCGSVGITFGSLPITEGVADGSVRGSGPEPSEGKGMMLEGVVVNPSGATAADVIVCGRGPNPKVDCDDANEAVFGKEGCPTSKDEMLYAPQHCQQK